MDIFTQCCCYMSIKWNNFLVVQELQKMFNDSDSFFYSPTGDLTNTLQRQFSGKYNAADPVWKRVSNVHPCKCTPVCAKFIDGLVITTKHGVLWACTYQRILVLLQYLKFSDWMLMAWPAVYIWFTQGAVNSVWLILYIQYTILLLLSLILNANCVDHFSKVGGHFFWPSASFLPIPHVHLSMFSCKCTEKALFELIHNE